MADPRGTAGPWGLEALRVLQLWNLNDLVARRRAVIGTGVVDAGFQDDDRDGFDDHPDLTHVRTFVFDPGTRTPGREATAERPRLVITTPLQPRVRVHVQGVSAEGALRVGRCAVVEPTAPGQDLWVALKACSGKSLEG